MPSALIVQIMLIVLIANGLTIVYIDWGGGSSQPCLLFGLDSYLLLCKNLPVKLLVL